MAPGECPSIYQGLMKDKQKGDDADAVEKVTEPSWVGGLWQYQPAPAKIDTRST